MEANPYVMLIDALAWAGRRPTRWSWERCFLPEPLRVLAEGNTLGPERLLLNAALKKDYEIPAEIRDPKGDLSIQTACSYSSHSAMTVTGGAVDECRLIRPEPDYKAGDLLLLLPIEGRQRYIAICRVVTP